MAIRKHGVGEILSDPDDQASLKRGIAQASRGELVDKGSFARDLLDEDRDIPVDPEEEYGRG
jgi:hypothetical protein